MKKRIKILGLFIAIFVFHGSAVGEEVVISAADSTYPKTVSHSNSSSANSYIFGTHQPAENGINTYRLLNEVQVSESQDHSFEGALAEADIRRRMAIFLQDCRILNQYSKLTKLLYPFHFFF